MDGGSGALVRSHRETPPHLGCSRLPNSHSCRCNSVVAFDRPAPGCKTNLARGIYGRLSPRRSYTGGGFTLLWGAGLSWGAVVLWSVSRRKPSPAGDGSGESP